MPPTKNALQRIHSMPCHSNRGEVATRVYQRCVRRDNATISCFIDFYGKQEGCKSWNGRVIRLWTRDTHREQRSTDKFDIPECVSVRDPSGFGADEMCQTGRVVSIW